MSLLDCYILQNVMFNISSLTMMY